MSHRGLCRRRSPPPAGPRPPVVQRTAGHPGRPCHTRGEDDLVARAGQRGDQPTGPRHRVGGATAEDEDLQHLVGLGRSLGERLRRGGDRQGDRGDDERDDQGSQMGDLTRLAEPLDGQDRRGVGRLLWVESNLPGSPGDCSVRSGVTSRAMPDGARACWQEPPVASPAQPIRPNDDPFRTWLPPGWSPRDDPPWDNDHDTEPKSNVVGSRLFGPHSYLRDHTGCRACLPGGVPQGEDWGRGPAQPHRRPQRRFPCRLPSRQGGGTRSLESRNS